MSARNANERNPLWRRAAVATGLAGLLFLTGCEAIPLFFPTRSDDTGPVSLTVEDGLLAFVPCTGDGVQLTDLTINVTFQRANGEKTDPIEVVQSEYMPGKPGSGSVSDPLRGGLPVVVGEPIPGMDFKTATSVRIADHPGKIGVGLGFTDEANANGTIWTNFPDTDFGELEEGTYLYPDGRVSTEPCGMTNAS